MLRLGRLHAGFSWRAFAQARLELSVERWPRVMRGTGYDLTIGCLQWWWYMAPLLLTACVHAAPPTDADRKALDDVRTAWHDAGLRDPSECGRMIEVRRHDTLQSYVDECAGMSPGAYAELSRHSAGCLTTELRGALGTQVGVIEVAPGYHDDMGLVQHEALHRLLDCAYGDPGSTHSDPRIWEAASPDPVVRARSVQARARGPDN